MRGGRGIFRRMCLVFLQSFQRFAVTAQRAGGKQCVVFRTAGQHLQRNETRGWSGFGMRGVAAEQIQAIEFVAGNQPLNLVENCQRIEGAEPWLEVIGR